MQERVDSIIDSNNDINKMIRLISDKITQSDYEIKKIEAQILQQRQACQKAIETEVQAYKTFASKWLEDPKNEDLVYEPLLCSKPEAGYIGLKSEELIEVIIQYNKQLEQSDIQNATQVYYELLNNRNENGDAFRSLLRQHFLDTSYNTAIESTITVHTGMQKQKEQAYMQMDDSLRNAFMVICENTRVWIESSVKQPFEWKELTQILTYLNCKTEAQQLLKVKLQEYINSRDPDLYYSFSFIGYDAKQLLLRRRQITYLVSCLYYASATEIDEGVLYSKELDNKSMLVGIDLILENLKLDEIRSSSLLYLLQTFRGEIDKRSLILGAAPITMDNPMIECDIDLKKLIDVASQKIALIMPTYTVRSLEMNRPAELLKALGQFPSVANPTNIASNPNQNFSYRM